MTTGADLRPPRLMMAGALTFEVPPGWEVEAMDPPRIGADDPHGGYRLEMQAAALALADLTETGMGLPEAIEAHDADLDEYLAGEAVERVQRHDLPGGGTLTAAVLQDTVDPDRPHLHAWYLYAAVGEDLLDARVFLSVRPDLVDTPDASAYAADLERRLMAVPASGSIAAGDVADAVVMRPEILFDAVTLGIPATWEVRPDVESGRLLIAEPAGSAAPSVRLSVALRAVAADRPLDRPLDGPVSADAVARRLADLAGTITSDQGHQAWTSAERLGPALWVVMETDDDGTAHRTLHVSYHMHTVRPQPAILDAVLTMPAALAATPRGAALDRAIRDEIRWAWVRDRDDG